MATDAGFAGALNQRILEGARAMMTMRNEHVAMGMPAQEAMRIVFDTCAKEWTGVSFIPRAKKRWSGK